MIYSVSPFSVAYDWSDCHQSLNRHTAGIFSHLPQSADTSAITVGGSTISSFSEKSAVEDDEDDEDYNQEYAIDSLPSPLTKASTTVVATLAQPKRPSHARRQTVNIQKLGNCYFQTRLSQLTSQNVADLTQTYRAFNGILPSRRELREVSQMIGVSQSEIKRWFITRARRPRILDESTASTTIPLESSVKDKATLDQLVKMTEDIERRVTVLETEIQKNYVLLQKCLENISSQFGFS